MNDADSESGHWAVVSARGHQNVSATHSTTLEITTDDWLTPTGDCIVGIVADTAPADFATQFQAACRHPGATIRVDLVAGDHEVHIVAEGDPELTFASERSMVIRTSDYVDDRTVAVRADTAAGDLDRALVDALAGGADLTCRLAVDDPS